MMLSAHFSLAEALLSQTAIRKGFDNTPAPEIIVNMRGAARRLEEVRALLAAPILVSSWYRSQRLNAAIGGAQSSAHLTGYAIDFTAPGFGIPRKVCIVLCDYGIQMDQVIQEGAWVHISFAPALRGQFLTAHFAAGRVTYTPGLE